MSIIKLSLSAREILPEISTDDLLEELDNRGECPEPDLSDFDVEDLMDEVLSRNEEVSALLSFESKNLLRAIYEKRRLGADYQSDLDQLIYVSLGMIL